MRRIYISTDVMSMVTLIFLMLFFTETLFLIQLHSLMPEGAKRHAVAFSSYLPRNNRYAGFSQAVPQRTTQIPCLPDFRILCVALLCRSAKFPHARIKKQVLTLCAPTASCSSLFVAYWQVACCFTDIYLVCWQRQSAHRVTDADSRGWPTDMAEPGIAGPGQERYPRVQSSDSKG